MNLEEWKLRNRRSRSYSHFDSRTSLDRVWKYIDDPTKVARHGFYPFIHYTQSFVKYKKGEGIKPKNREICYSAHLDRFIYSYYGHKLNGFYNGKVKQLDIDDSVIAYRDNLHKNNIHFAKRAIDYIKSTNDCYIMIGDFTGFFDNLDHTYLKKMLCKVMDVEKLPSDYFAVYKNITKYSYWNIDSLLELNNLKMNNEGILELKQLKTVLTPEQFKALKKEHIKPNPNCYGIPQGSAISAVLSNIYMLEFDEAIKRVVSAKQGLYMRYSDDFIIVLPKVSVEQYKHDFEILNTNIQKIPSLKLEPDKTQVFHYTNRQIISCNEMVLDCVKNKGNFMNYLGFTFDGQNVTLRDKTISKYYYKLYRKLKTISKNKGVTKNGRRISCENVYLRYSVKGSGDKNGNFLTYVRRAENIFGSHERVAQIRKKHMQKIRKKLNEV